MDFKSQITVFLENQPGIMATLCKILRDNGINIDAFTVFGTIDHGVFRLIVDKPESTLDILSHQGFLAIESKVIEVPADNSPGSLFEVSDLLARERVNIEYAYGSTNTTGNTQRFFLQASDNLKAKELLENLFKTTNRKKTEPKS